MTDPLVSIVTPTLDPGPRLKRCLDSVGSQSYEHIEHLVMDGGSTDGTIHLLEADGRARWISEPDDGQAQAINKGWKMSKGEILGWLNADDELTPGAVEAVVMAFASDASIGWVYGDVLTLEGKDRYVRRAANINRPSTWAARNLASQPGSFNRRWALERVGYLNETYHYMMDLDLWLRLLDAGIPSRYVPEVLAVFEVHDASKSGSVPRWKFVSEEARTRLGSGRTRSGAAALGRAAALKALDGEALSWTSVHQAIDEMLSTAPAIPPSNSDLVLAGARAEIAVTAPKSRILPYLAFLHPSVWRYGETRSRLVDAARRAVGRTLRRLKRR